MPPTISSKRGDVVLVGFVFSDESSVKRRPAVILSTEFYHRGRQEVIVAAVTSNVDRLLAGDYRIAGWQQAGLLHPSVATGILRTIKRSMIRHRLGNLLSDDMRGIEAALKKSLGL